MSNADFQLSLFGDTALDGNANLFWGELEGEEGDAPGALLPAVEPLVIPQTDFRLAGLRGLAQGWKARARTTSRRSSWSLPSSARPVTQRAKSRRS